jgi:RHS repeat-associated protein
MQNSLLGSHRTAQCRDASVQTSRFRLNWLKKLSANIMSWLVIILATLCISISSASAQTAEGDYGWRSDAEPFNITFATAADACRAQHQYYMGDVPKSRFIGAFPTDNPDRARCSWTSFQYLCPQETGGGVFGCWTILPSTASRGCAPGYKRVAGKYCAKQDELVPERGCGADNNGGQQNPAVGHPFILSTGCKILHAKDYVSADGLMEVSRSYRSLAVGESQSARAQPLGLAGNWAFDFANEIQLGNFSGTPSAPDAKLALVKPDGTAYDFAMQSGGAIEPNTATGPQYAPKNIKIEYVGTLPEALSDIPASSSQWRVTDEKETVWTFQTFTRTDFAGFVMGRPVSKVTKENYRWDFSYNADGALQTITDSFGRQLVFTWHYFHVSVVPGQGTWPEAVQSVTLPDGTSIRYTYDPPGVMAAPSTGQIERLVKAERLSSTATVLQSTGYNYADPRHHWHITGITRTDGQTVASYTYDARGRGLTSALAGNVEPYAVAMSETGSEVVRSVTGPLGKIDEYRFQRLGGPTQFRITQVNGLLNATTPATTHSISYGPDSFIASETDKENRTTNFVRDVRGNPTTIVEAAALPEQRTTGVTIHPTLNLPSQEVRPGLTVDYTYDAQGKMLTRTATDTTTHTVPYSTNGQARTWTYGWASNGRLLSINGPKPVTATKDDTLTFTYSPQGNLLTSTNGLGHVTTFAGHDANGRPATMTSPNNIVTAFTYDPLGRTTAINVKHPTNAANDAITAIEYDSQDRVIGITAPVTDKLIIDYNVAGQLTAVRAASGERIDYVSNAAGGVTSEITKRANGTTARSIGRTFDALNRMLTETLGPNRTTTWSYDKVGNATQLVSAQSNATQMAFDGLDRLVSTTHPGGGSETLAYNPLDDVTGFTDAISVATTYVRNGFGEAIQEISPDRGTSTYTYNAGGELMSMTDGRGQVTNYTRDILGRTLTATPVGRPASEVITYTYDTSGLGSYKIGRLMRVVDGSGTTSFQYDHRGNMLVKRQTVGTSTAANLTYAYDRADRVTQITYPSGRIVGYVRDSKGRITTVRTKALSSVTTWTNLATAMQYEPFAALKQATLGNTLSMTVNWGNDGRLASRRLYKTSGGTNLSLLSYAYDNDDNITGITDGLTPANNVAYAYDVRGRLSQVSLAATSTAPFKRSDYGHDANGNRTSIERRVDTGDAGATETDSYSLSAGTNRLATISTPAVTRNLTYDARGNLAMETRGTGVTATTAYDGHGRLTGYARTGDPTFAHGYNGLGDRTLTATTPWGGGTADTRRFVTAPDGRAMGEYGASATDVRAEFIWLSPQVGGTGTFGGDDGLGGYMPIAVATIGGTLSWVHGDHLGTPVLMTDATGTAIAQPAGYTTPAFPGQSKTLPDLYYNRYRDYDPTTGRYIQADPIGLTGGASPYSYAMGNPLRYTDPTGQCPWCAVIIGGVVWGLVDASLDYAMQRYWEGKDPDCIDWKSVAISGGIGALTGGIGGVGRMSWKVGEFSHWIPERYVNSASKSYKPWLDKGPIRKFIDSPYNGNNVPRWVHEKSDFWRRTKGSRVADKWPFPVQQVVRAPSWVWAPVGAAGVGVAGANGDD